VFTLTGIGPASGQFRIIAARLSDGARVGHAVWAHHHDGDVCQLSVLLKASLRRVRQHHKGQLGVSKAMKPWPNVSGEASSEGAKGRLDKQIEGGAIDRDPRADLLEAALHQAGSLPGSHAVYVVAR
jgi:hypothetical protein